uniref:Uncharacterized protein n=1 Tax=Sciurus vulgaris TaxID=55149 RepID=A0A8D2D4I6_SCIVU
MPRRPPCPVPGRPLRGDRPGRTKARMRGHSGPRRRHPRLAPVGNSPPTSRHGCSRRRGRPPFCWNCWGNLGTIQNQTPWDWETCPRATPLKDESDDFSPQRFLVGLRFMVLGWIEFGETPSYCVMSGNVIF